MNRNRQDQLMDQFGYAVRQLLNHGADHLSPRTLQRLSAARSMALAKQRSGDPLAELAPAHGRGAFAEDVAPRRAWLALAMSIVFVLGGVSLINEWHNRQAISEIADIDSAILSDDLPIAAHADPGFVDFLKRVE